MEASRVLPSSLAVRAGPGTLTVLAAAMGVLYTFAAYFYGPTIIPYLVVGSLFLWLGVWRLEYGLAVLIVVAPLSGEQPLASSDDVQIDALLSVITSLKTWLVLLTLLELGRAVVQRRPLHAPAGSIAVVALLVAACFGVLIAPDQSDAAAAVSILAGSAAVYFLIAFFIDEWDQVKVVLGGVVAAGLLISCHAIWQYYTGHFSSVGFYTAGTFEYRVASFFEHPNQLAGYVVFMIPIGIGLFRLYTSRWARFACAALAVLAAVAVLFTFSRGAYLGVVALPFVYIGSRRVWPLIIAAAVVIVLAAPAALGDRIAEINDTSSPEIANRLDLWDAAEQIFEDQPVTGAGLAGFGEAYVDLERTDRLALDLEGIPISAHSLYLNTLAEQGLIGFAALLSVFIAGIRVAILLRRSADERARAVGQTLLGVGIVVAIHNIFDVTFTDHEATTLTLLALLGVGAAALRIDRRDAAGGPADGWR
jgi:O-antigen ligase